MLRESKKDLAMRNYKKVLKKRVQAEFFIQKELEKQLRYEKKFSKRNNELFSPKNATQQSLVIDQGRKILGYLYW